MSSAASESYDDEEREEESESESSSPDEADLVSEEPLPPSTDYFWSMDTQHKDFVRSMAQIGENILITASEDKSMKVFYFQY